MCIVIESVRWFRQILVIKKEVIKCWRRQSGQIRSCWLHYTNCGRKTSVAYRTVKFLPQTSVAYRTISGSTTEELQVLKTFVKTVRTIVQDALQTHKMNCSRTILIQKIERFWEKVKLRLHFLVCGPHISRHWRFQVIECGPHFTFVAALNLFWPG